MACFHLLREPYRTAPGDTLRDFVRRYEADEARVMMIGKRTYHRLLSGSHLELNSHDFTISITMRRADP